MLVAMQAEPSNAILRDALFKTRRAIGNEFVQRLAILRSVRRERLTWVGTTELELRTAIDLYLAVILDMPTTGQTRIDPDTGLGVWN